MRELSALSLVIANGVFLFLGFSRLFFVLDGWASTFGLRCVAVFGDFAGPYAIGFPMAALLLATHLSPMVRRARLVLSIVLAEYATSAVFGLVSFLGAFAQDLSSSARATMEGLLERSVWLALLVLAIVVACRVWLGLYPSLLPRPASVSPYHSGSYHSTVYGQPYPAQPVFPQLTPQAYPTTDPSAMTRDTAGWPVVPPPPMPAPLVVDPDPTMRVSLSHHDTPAGGTQAVVPEQGGDATQVVPAQEPPEQQ